MVIAIDGPAGVGKSSLAKMIADKLKIYYLNSGNFYRGATLKLLKTGLDPEKHGDRVKATSDARFDIINERFFLDGEDVEDKLHSREIDMTASYVSSDPDVRVIINRRIHEISGTLSLICEGRDITTVVVFVTDPDVHTEFHPDHIRIGKIVKTVVSQASNPRIMEKYGARSASIKAVAFYFSSATNCVCRAGRAFKTKMRVVFDCHLSQFPLNSTATYSFKKYLKFRKFFGKEESFRVVTHIQMHCFPEADE